MCNNPKPTVKDCDCPACADYRLAQDVAATDRAEQAPDNLPGDGTATDTWPASEYPYATICNLRADLREARAQIQRLQRNIGYLRQWVSGTAPDAWQCPRCLRIYERQELRWHSATETPGCCPECRGGVPCERVT